MKADDIMANALYNALPSKDSAASDETRKRDRYLVLDSRIIEEKSNVELTVGVAHKDKSNPLFKEDKPWEPRFDNPYCSVIL